MRLVSCSHSSHYTSAANIHPARTTSGHHDTHRMPIKVIITILAALLLLAACDRPAVSETEAIANVKMHLQQTRVFNNLDVFLSCDEYVQRWYSSDLQDRGIPLYSATYEGDGRWRVRSGGWKWDYFEKSNAIVSYRAPSEYDTNC